MYAQALLPFRAGVLSLSAFRKTTEAHCEKKVANPGWAGYGPEAPQLRRKPGAVRGDRVGEPPGRPPVPQRPSAATPRPVQK